MAVTRTRAALALQHESLGAQHVTEVLGVQPTESFEVGDAYARDSRRRAHSHWALDSPADPDTAALHDQLRVLLDRLLPLRAQLERLRDEGYRLTWTCYVEECDGDGTVLLSSDLLRDLATLPVDLAVESYADAPAE
ncbi:MAG: DUF4279 domain-containing protein [Actinomycetales bacterium]|nr:DUF4279 domain-containing protein [Actinomycetales bacterium]